MDAHELVRWNALTLRDRDTALRECAFYAAQCARRHGAMDIATMTRGDSCIFIEWSTLRCAVHCDKLVVYTPTQAAPSVDYPMSVLSKQCSIVVANAIFTHLQDPSQADRPLLEVW